MKKKALTQKLENNTPNYKKLILMRHAKSDWTAGCSDFDRPLNKRGSDDLVTMGHQMSQLNQEIELIIASPAERTYTTALQIAKSINYPVEHIQKEPSIYEGSFSDLNQIIEQLNNNYSTVLIIGHNPTFTYLIDYFSGSSIGNLPTSAIAVISFNVDDWKAVSFNSGMLEHYIYPKKFK